MKKLDIQNYAKRACGFEVDSIDLDEELPTGPWQAMTDRQLEIVERFERNREVQIEQRAKEILKDEKTLTEVIGDYAPDLAKGIASGQDVDQLLTKYAKQYATVELDYGIRR